MTTFFDFEDKYYLYYYIFLGYDSMDLAVAKPCLRAELEVDLKA